MRMSDLLRLGKNAMLFAAGIVIVVGILWLSCGLPEMSAWKEKH